MTKLMLPKTLPSLTSCRFIAALAVLIHHSVDRWPGSTFDLIARNGWLGVPFFFILSGFVLMWSFDPSQSKKDFYVHRLSRIYPLHVIGLTISLLSFYFFGRAGAGGVGDDFSILANSLLVQDWFPGYEHKIGMAWNGVSWTLSCELFFYMLAPYLFANLALANAKQRLTVLCIIWVLIVCGSSYCVHRRIIWGYDFLQFHPLPNLLDFMLGATLAKFIKDNPQRKPFDLGLILWLITIIVWRCVFGIKGNPILNVLIVPSLAYLIATLAHRDLTGRTSLLRHPVLILLGESSFALYMFHALILAAAHEVTAYVSALGYALPSDMVIISMAIVCIVASVGIHKWIEIPLRRLILKHFATNASVNKLFLDS